MKKREAGLGFPAVVLLVWIAIFAYLAWDDNYTLFIKPGFAFLIYSGLFICILFLISLIAGPGTHNSRQGTLNGLILLLPVIFILSAGEQTLSTFSLSKRTLMSPAAGTGSSDAAEDPARGPDELQPPEISLSRLLKNWSDYSGKTVTIQGLFHHSLEDNDQYSLIFKYLITCCVADAMPVGIFVEKKKIQGLTDKDWVSATGVVRLGKMNGNTVVFMTLDRIEKIEQPSKSAAYLFF